MPHSAASDLGLHFLPIMYHFEGFRTEMGLRIFYCLGGRDMVVWYFIALSKVQLLIIYRSPRDSQKYFEISIPQHIRFAGLRKK